MLVFYRDALGLRVGYQNKGFANLRAGNGAEVALHAGREGLPTQERYWILEFVVTDIEATVTSLTARGIKVGPIRKESFGKIAEFRDPEGNVIGLEEPPSR